MNGDRMSEKSGKRSDWKQMSALTRVLFVVSTVLIGFGLLGMIVSLIFTHTSWVNSFYSASLYSNTVGVLLLLLTTLRLVKDRERARAEGQTRVNPKDSLSE